MHRAATGWVRRAGGNFAEVPQTDAEEDRSQSSRQSSRLSSHEKRTSDQFRQHVQNLLQQGNIEDGLEAQSLHSSPALSDHTLVSGDYLEVHGNEYREVDISNYAEYGDYYGPQPTNVSPTKSLKAGLGIEVRHMSTGSDLTIDEGLFMDDPLADISYKGSEGNIEQQVPGETPNYKPLILKKRFLLVLLVTLVILLALTELTVHLLPEDTNGLLNEDDDNSTESQLRSRSLDYVEKFDGEWSFSLLRERKNHPGGGNGVINASPTISSVEVPVTVSTDTPTGATPTTTSQIKATTTTGPTKEPTSTQNSMTTTIVEVPTTPQAPPTTSIPVTTDITTSTTSTSPSAPSTIDTTTQKEETTKHSTPSGSMNIQTTLPSPSPTEPDQGGTEPTPTNTPTSTPIATSAPTETPPTETPPTERPTIQTHTNIPGPQPSDDPETTTDPQVTNTKPPGQNPGTTGEDPTKTKPPVETHSPIPTTPEKPPEHISTTERTAAPGPSDILSILPIDIPTTSHEMTILPIDLPTTSHEMTILPIDISTASDIFTILPIDTGKPPPTPSSDPPAPTSLPPTSQPPPGPSPDPPTPTSHHNTDLSPTGLPTQPPHTLPTETPTNRPTDLPPKTSPVEKPPPDQPAQTQTPPQPTKGDPTKGQPTHDEPTQGQPTATLPTSTELSSITTPPPPPTSKTAIVPVPQSPKVSPSMAKSPSPESPSPTSAPSSPTPSSPHVADTLLSTPTLSPTSVITKSSSQASSILSTSKPGLIHIQDPSSDVSGFSTKTSQSTPNKIQDEDENPFSTLVPFTTLILTEATSTRHPSPTPTLDPSASDYRNFTDEFGLGQKFLESALTFYTPVDGGGHTKAPFWALQNVITAVETDARGKPTKTQTQAILYGARTTVLTDYQGVPTKTVTYYVIPYTTTLRDGNGKATATRTGEVSKVPVTNTLTDENGVATSTVTDLIPMSSSTVVRVVTATPTASANSSSIEQKTAMRVTDAQYFGVLMLPTLLAIALAIPIRILDRTAKLYQPFHAMTLPNGAPASESLCLETSGARSLLTAFYSAMNGHYLLILTGVLVLASAVLIPLSGEVMRIAFRGPNCIMLDGNPINCAMGIAVLPHIARAVVGVLAFMTVLICITAAVLWRWMTGVARPWSLNYMAHLATNDDIRVLLQRARKKDGKVTADRINKQFRDKSFVLDYWKDNATLKYGILVLPTIEQPLKRERKFVTFGEPPKQSSAKPQAMPFFLLTFAGRLIFLSFLLAVLIFVLVYHVTGERRIGWIMVGESLGVRILFTVLGVLITFAWESFFYAVVFLSPFRFLNRKRSSYNREAQLMTPPTNVFSGVWYALVRRPRDVYLGVVAIAGIFAQLLPLLLSNVPFEALHSYPGFEPSTWISVMILCVMMFVIIGSFLIRWPHMPIDPTTVAGAMHYATDPTGSSSVTGTSPSAGLLHGGGNTGLV